MNEKVINNNTNAIAKLFNLYSELISCRFKYGPIKYDTSIVIYVDHRDHKVTEKSSRYIGDLNDPIIVAKILLFLSEIYSKLGVDKKDFDDKYTKFIAWYLRKEKPEIKNIKNIQEKDIINHPEHYTKGGIEVREFIDSWHLDFNSGNVIKYVVRAPYKGTELQDLKKAQNYLNHLIELKEKEEAKK